MPYKGWKKPGSELEEKLQQFDWKIKKHILKMSLS